MNSFFASGVSLSQGGRRSLGPGRQFFVLGNHAELLLVRENRFAQLLVAVVEQVHRVDLVHPLFLRMMRRMRGARHVVEEDRLAGIGLVDAVHPVDGVVGHGGDQVPGWLLAGDGPDLRLWIRSIHLQGALMANPRIDLRGVAEQVRSPLVGIATDEAVEIIEAHAVRPLSERPGLAGLVRRCVVILAEPRRRVTVVAQDATDGGIVHANDAVVAGETGGLFGDHAEADRVVIAPGERRGTRRRAQRSRENAVVAQAFIGDAVHGRCRDDAAEGARNAETRVVGHDKQDVGRVLGRHDARRPPLRGINRVILDHPAEFRLGRGKLLTTDGRGGTGRAQFAGNLRRELGLLHRTGLRRCAGRQKSG